MMPWTQYDAAAPGTGLSVAIKDSIDVRGWPTQGGSRAYADAPPAQADAQVVRALRQAGWRILGKTVLHELAFGVTGINDWAGTPINPQAPDRIPGGSSSGSAVAVAAGLADVALGTDTGGSVRLPAACCGVFGLKPTFGRLSRAGALPAHTSLDCIGPFARDMAALVEAMRVLAPPFRLPSLNEVPRIGVVSVNTDAEVAGAIEASLRRSGWHCETVSLRLLDDAFEAALTVINAETWAAFGHFTGQGTLGGDVELRLGKARSSDASAVADAEQVRARFSAEVDHLLQRYDALALPTLPSLPPTVAAVRAGAPVIDLTRFVRPFNLSGHPALSIPVPCPGLPLRCGLQLVGRQGDDERLCALAARLEHLQ